MQEISAYVSENKFSATATGDLTNEYIDEFLHICVLSNINVKASRIAFWYRESEDGFTENIPPETAFILYDKTTAKTFFATDTFAVKPLFYSLQSGKLLIHSNLKDLLVFSERNALNLNKTVEYFKWKSDDLPADNQTFYQNIFRLLPAQIGIFQNEKLTFRNNATFTKVYDSISESEIVNKFKVAFENAVSQRKTNDISAANLSGGLDSSSVVAALSPQINRKLFTIYFNAQKLEADERDFARNIVEKYGTNHQEVTAPKSLFDSLVSLTEKIAQPDPGVLPSFIHEVIFDKAAKINAKRLFSGHGGDNVVGYGYEYLDDLFDAKHWKKLKEEGRKYDSLRQNDEPIVKSIFKRNIKKAYQQKEYWNALKLVFICWLHFGIIPLPSKFVIFKDERIQLPDYEQLENKILRIKPKESSSIYQSFKSIDISGKFTKNQQKHVDFSFIRLAINGNEVLSTLGHYCDIGVSLPFFDGELLNVSIQATEKQKFDNGYLRGTLRNGLAEYLPDEVKNRVTKADFTSAAMTYFELLYKDFRKAFPLNHKLWDVVDSQTFQQLVNIILSDKFTVSQKVKYTWLGMRVINFGIWLNQQELENED